MAISALRRAQPAVPHRQHGSPSSSALRGGARLDQELAEEKEMGFGRPKRSREEQRPAFRVRDPRPRQTSEDSIRFLADMKRDLAGEPEKYDEFIAVMREYREGRMETAAMVDQVKVLLAGYPSLLRGFNVFLPWDYIRANGPAGGCCI